VVRGRAIDGEIELGFLEPCDSPVRDRAALGGILSRVEVAASVSCDRFVEIAGAVLLEDPAVNEYIAG